MFNWISQALDCERHSAYVLGWTDTKWHEESKSCVSVVSAASFTTVLMVAVASAAESLNQVFWRRVSPLHLPTIKGQIFPSSQLYTALASAVMICPPVNLSSSPSLILHQVAGFIFNCIISAFKSKIKICIRFRFLLLLCKFGHGKKPPMPPILGSLHCNTGDRPCGSVHLKE